ncbi:DUF4097 family beta strand repeat-containing protein [Flagellimonas sp. HMM57]|uniref:DUF4097 family beta strand repeat-containing protein n=1 Tax=unclassified Flagellimonas TaxID=2644544 RepID=UPI0013D25E0B|nr:MULTISPECIES: DUF4097 family beta strand repeat-containing protein [unclassified Flagellimonas]UII75218.1 DUF4097 family beta strand repeat-containing protein [Flagellimonas sp. HMM57]
MNRNHQILFNVFLILMAGITCYGQEKSKTYKETFNVDNDAELNINTSHTDIEFETWNKNQVEITAVVEIEDATDEEAKSYFDKEIVKIMGNSREIEVSTRERGFGNGFNVRGMDIDIPDMSFIEPLFESIAIPELPEVIVIPDMPPVPPVPNIQFDYDAYKRDGDAYMKEWKKDFDKNFNEEYKERFEAWGDRVKEMAEKKAERIEEREQKRKELLEKRNEMREEAREKRNQALKERNEKRKIKAKRVYRINRGDDSDTFYFSSDGESRRFKVKKYIKIKMPKSIKLKMNVRHGEVKLAENAKNINASLSYASLQASTIDGDRTDIRASYSPVVVQNWNYGQLKTDYSDRVDLKEVGELQLSTVSSNVVIERLKGKAFVKNSLGELRINSVGNNFSTIDITVENGEVACKIPSIPFFVYVNETLSELEYPKTFVMESSKSHGSNVYKGYHIDTKNHKAININSRYSEVVLKQ